jgi:hypothetical protein
MLVLTKIDSNNDVIAGLHPQSSCQFSRQPSARVSQVLRSSSYSHMICSCYVRRMGTAVAQWLRFCATNRKVAGSIPDDVTGFFR